MTPLERAARALAKHFPNPYSEADFPLRGDAEMRAIVEAGHKAAVRAVLQAIREPSKRMCNAGGSAIDSMPDDDIPDGYSTAATAYAAMIDAALEEK